MTCLACGTEIPPERRAAMPLAEFCVTCQPEPRPLTDVDVPEAMAVQTDVDVTDFGWGS